MTKAKAIEAAEKSHVDTGKVVHVWRKNLIPQSTSRSHMCYDYAPLPDGIAPRGDGWERMMTIGMEDQGGLFDDPAPVDHEALNARLQGATAILAGVRKRSNAIPGLVAHYEAEVASLTAQLQTA